MTIELTLPEFGPTGRPLAFKAESFMFANHRIRMETNQRLVVSRLVDERDRVDTSAPSVPPGGSTVLPWSLPNAYHGAGVYPDTQRLVLAILEGGLHRTAIYDSDWRTATQYGDTVYADRGSQLHVIKWMDLPR